MVTEYVGLVDTDRDELRERIAEAQDRFDQLIRTASPHDRPRGMDWTVAQVGAHMVTIVQRYGSIARTGGFRMADRSGIPSLNDDELQSVSGSLPEIADRIRELEPEMSDFFDTVSGHGQVLPFHGGVSIDGITTQTNWLGELLLHGEDIARAVGRPWEISERDMLLVARGLMQIAPGFVRPGSCPGDGIRTIFLVPGARPYFMHLHDDTVDARARRSDDRADAVLRLPASTLTRMLYQRIGPLTAARRGLLIVGGRRPWRALKVQSCIERV